MDSATLALVFQMAGIWLLVVLFGFLSRTFHQDEPLRLWTLSWGSLGAALACLLVSFGWRPVGRIFEALYLLGEYAFAFFLYAGCRSLAGRGGLARRDLWVAVPAIALAAGLPRLSADFDVVFGAHAAVLALVFLFSLGELSRRKAPVKGHAAGIRLTRAALVILCVDFGHYSPVFLYVASRRIFDSPYLRYTSAYDLIFEVMLGFGQIVLVFEELLAAREETNGALREARDRLAVLAELDPLTEALNRHAFYSRFEGESVADARPQGCVALIDVDDLKGINDSFGHVAGDGAIRAAAGAVRGSIRSEDLLFRWGGDEFLAVLFGVSPEEAARRLRGLEEEPIPCEVPGASGLRVSVSVGVAPFGPGAKLDDAIDRADASMYGRKRARRARATRDPMAPG